MTQPKNINVIQSVEALSAINGTPNPRTLVKKITGLDAHARNFIKRSPFLILATKGSDGSDASPRGDAPGFVKCLDDSTLLIPERPGNRIADSMRNIIADPQLGLLLMIPGMDDTLRINGNGYITDHAPHLEALSVAGKVPKLAIVVDITEIYFHCPKAFIRSKLWNPDAYMDRSDLPTLGKMIMDQISAEAPTDEVVKMVDAALEADVKTNLY